MTDYRGVHAKVYIAIKRGRLIRSKACERCGASGGRIEAHHPDYRKPLAVEFLCVPCHRRHHARPHEYVAPPSVAKVHTRKVLIALTLSEKQDFDMVANIRGVSESDLIRNTRLADIVAEAARIRKAAGIIA